MSIGKHFIVNVASIRLSENEKRLLRRFAPAGVMLFRKNFEVEVPYSQWLAKLKDLVAEIRDCVGREDLIIATDFEGGRVTHFPAPINSFPFAMKFGELSSEVGKAQAEILKAHGFNFSFAPVADIHSNPANPVIGPRAFGTTAQEVVAGVVPYLQALLSAGVIPCAKHFPGHGDTKSDSHLHLPALEHDLSLLRRRELVPFKALIDAGAPAIMTAHVVFKALDPKLPATMSRAVLTNLLRQELGFNGVILSDCLTGMRAIFEGFSVAQVVRNFFSAGGDIAIMWHREGVRHDEYFLALEDLANKEDALGRALADSERRIEPLLKKLRKYEVTGLTPEALTRNEALIERINVTVQPLFLQEAPYQETLPPKEEPSVRVGIVLAEDGITQEKITFPADGHIFCNDGEKFKISSGTTVEINATTDGMDIFTAQPQRTRIALVRNKITFKTNTAISFAPQNGFLVERVVAGRTFHWRKEIPQYFSGQLELYCHLGKLHMLNEVPFEEYLSGVATAEMSAACPLDTLKAQIIAARSYSLAYMHGKHRGEPFSVCNDDDCQRYQGTTNVAPHVHKAIQETRGEVLVFDGLVVRAHYSKCCAGFVDTPENTWEISVPGLPAHLFDGDTTSSVSQLDFSKEEDFRKFLELPPHAVANIYCAVDNMPAAALKKYLGSVDEQAEYFRWTYELSAEQLITNLREKFLLADVASITKVEAVPSKVTGRVRSKAGRVMAVDIHYLDASGAAHVFHIPREYNIRKALHPSFLFSSAFLHEQVLKDGKLKAIKFRGAGWGHGSGYCQIGGLGMALKGFG
jgi:beta-N-acetylhexosaminidase